MIFALCMIELVLGSDPAAGRAFPLSAAAEKRSEGEAEMLAQAAAAFRDGENAASRSKATELFLKAADLYEVLGQRGVHNAALFRNQGNAYLLAGDLPRAVLAYRRGLRLAPGDRSLQASLNYAREQVAYPQDWPAGAAASFWPLVLPPWVTALLAWLAFSCYLFAWIGMTRWRMTRRGLFLGAGVAALVVAALLAGAVFLEDRQHRLEEQRPLVVVAREGSVFLRKGNGNLYDKIHDKPLDRGVEARRLAEQGNWLQIELPGGVIGWVSRADVLVDF